MRRKAGVSARVLTLCIGEMRCHFFLHIALFRDILSLYRKTFRGPGMFLIKHVVQASFFIFSLNYVYSHILFTIFFFLPCEFRVIETVVACPGKFHHVSVYSCATMCECERTKSSQRTERGCLRSHSSLNIFIPGVSSQRQKRNSRRSNQKGK